MLVLTYNPDSHLSDGERVLDRIRDEFRSFGRVGTLWGCATKSNVNYGVPFCILQQGAYGRGIFAKGFVVGLIEGGSEDRTVASICITEFVDPRRGKFLHDEAESKKMLGYLNWQGSGYFARETEAA